MMARNRPRGYAAALQILSIVSNTHLLAGTLRRAFEIAGTIGFSMVVVDALDEAVAGFHAAHRFVRLPDPLRLVLPMRLAAVGAERSECLGFGEPVSCRANSADPVRRVHRVPSKAAWVL